MRLPQQQIEFFKQYAPVFTNSNKVYLFGSRTDNAKMGGDIDIAILTEKLPTHFQIYKFKILFYKKFGEQRLDIKCFTQEDNSLFKKHIFSYAIEL